MKTQLLSAVFAIAGAALLLGLRHLIVSFGKKKAERSASGHPHVFISRVEEERDSIGYADSGASSYEPEIAASPLRVEEFLAELRAKSRGER
ncbi:MAG TPA: hypothetical protein VID27_03610 [Blastocatellia bacterium]|jgi:hypothetical protein